MKKKSYLYGMGLLCIYILEAGSLFLLSGKYYQGAFDRGFFMVLLLGLCSLSAAFYGSFKEKEILEWFFALQLVFLFVVPLIFFMTKPEFTYQKALKVINGDKAFRAGETVVEDKKADKVPMDSKNPLVRKAYVIRLRDINGVYAYVRFDPINGSYKRFEKKTDGPILF